MRNRNIHTIATEQRLAMASANTLAAIDSLFAERRHGLDRRGERMLAGGVK